MWVAAESVTNTAVRGPTLLLLVILSCGLSGLFGVPTWAAPGWAADESECSSNLEHPLSFGFHKDLETQIEVARPLVRRMASNLIRLSPTPLTTEDLQQEGLLGLWRTHGKALKTRDTEHFGAQANLAIRSAMIDALRKAHPYSRNDIKNGNHLAVWQQWPVAFESRAVLGGKLLVDFTEFEPSNILSRNKGASGALGLELLDSLTEIERNVMDRVVFRGMQFKEASLDLGLAEKSARRAYLRSIEKLKGLAENTSDTAVALDTTAWATHIQGAKGAYFRFDWIGALPTEKRDVLTASLTDQQRLVLSLTLAGRTGVDIAGELGVTKARVSRIKREISEKILERLEIDPFLKPQ